MRQRNSAARRRFEYAAATVIVCPPITTILDGIIRGRFSCQVHPVGGGEVKTFDVWAFFSWEAANIAIERYKEAAR
jgi:hypothetical protein